jgi:CSLREA domain-containing protein
MSPKPFLGILLAIAVSAALPLRSAEAAPIAVTTTTDELNTDGDCSLREAIRAANTNAAVDDCDAGENAQTDTITVPAGTYTLTVPGNDNDAAVGDLDLRDNAAIDDLVIAGAGAATTIIQACAVEQLAADCPAGHGIADRVLNVFDAHVAISGLTIRHGRAPVQSNVRYGSGIWVQRFNGGTALALTDVAVTKNGDSTGGNSSYGGGIANWYGALTLTRTTVSDNQATAGGGISNSFSDASGTATVLMTDSTVTGNTALMGGGIYNEESAAATCTNSTISDNRTRSGFGQSPYTNTGAGFFNFRATATFTGCTIRDNVAANRGGGLLNATTHISLPSVITLTDSTISGNRTEVGGPAALLNDNATATLTNCTISGNQAADTAGGIYTLNGSMNLRSTTITANRLLFPSHGAGGIWASGPMVLRNTIIAGNFHDDPNPAVKAPDCTSGSVSFPVSEGYSLVGGGSHCPGLVDGVSGDQIGTHAAPIDAKLGPLADYGGPTLTHALMNGSPAIDGGNPATPGSGGTACPTTDQRGETRPTGAACDIGSVESIGSAALAAFSVQPVSGGTAGTVQLRVFGDGFVTGAVVRLVRAGFADVVGAVTSALGTVITASLDLRDVAPGVWSVEVQNPDASVATLTDAFTVVAGGGSDLWVELLTPSGFQAGRMQSIYVLVGNRGTVDAVGVPFWLAFGEPLRWIVPFVVSPPPAQPGQIATDWSRIGIDLWRAPSPELPEEADSFHFLLPIVPASSSSAFRVRVLSPLTLEPGAPGSPAAIYVGANVGDPYFDPDLSEDVVAFYVAQGKDYAVRAHGTTTFPADAAIEAYVRTQLAEVVADGLAAVGDESESPPIYSQSHLIVDTGQFIAGESATASATFTDRHHLARLVTKIVGGAAEAYVTPPDPCAQFNLAVNKAACEAEIDPCRHGCPDEDAPLVPPPFNCDGTARKVLNFLGLPCVPPAQPTVRPTPKPVPFRLPHDPNEKAGPGGPGGYIDGVTPLNYTVTFENLKTATGDAFEVLVTDQLDVTKYDLDTFSLGPISFADRVVNVPPGLKTFSTEVDMRPGVSILVGIDAALDMATGLITWKFTTLDPATHEFPEEPEDGFLPPNVNSPEGEGEMLFTVSLKPGFGLGTTVCNDASIVFDFNPAIVTNEFCNTIGKPEDCENCIDDDGDTLVDRADPDCAPPANAAGVGVGDAKAGKAVDKCAKAIRKVGAKLASNKLKQLGACQKAVADCVQLKPGEAACLAKAQAKCAKARTGLPGAEAKLTAAIPTACGEPTVATSNLLADVGLGFDDQTSACEGRGVGTVATATDVAECVRRQQVCAAERALGAVVPRARELLVLGGFDADTDFRCLAGTTNGGGLAIAAEKRKALRKCDGAIQKATAKLLAGRTKAAQSCGAAVFSCVQTKPGDQACVAKSSATCTKAVAALPKLEASFASTIAKSCGAPLTVADLLASEGLGASGLAASCARLGVPSLTSVADVTACLERQLACRADQMLESTTPRLEELLGLGGVALP